MQRAMTAALGPILLGAAVWLAGCSQPLPFVEVRPAGMLLSGNTPPPLAARELAAVAFAAGTPLQPDSWTNVARVELSFNAAVLAPGSQLEVEFLPEQQPLVGVPNVAAGAAQRTVLSPEMAAGERYHWAIRVRDAVGAAGAWVHFPGVIGYQPTPPPPPAIQPLPRKGWVATRSLEVHWSDDSDPAGTAGYAYWLDRDRAPAGGGGTELITTGTSVQIPAPDDGDWYFHVRTLDNAGNASAAATVPVHVDTKRLIAEAPTFDAAGAWNPATGELPVQVAASKPAHLTLSVLSDDSGDVIRHISRDETSSATIDWDGKDDQGNAVPPGAYQLRLDASDQAGRAAHALAGDVLQVTNKRIVVSLGDQRLRAYEGDRVVLDTLVTTGGPELPTPTGTFHIIHKFSPFTFKSPWPKTSPYWYPDSPTSYAMLFENSGYFIHDAPWRSWFGPGSNARDGTPGGDGTGTHGCVNVPLSAEARLFAWTDLNTPVIIEA